MTENESSKKMVVSPGLVRAEGMGRVCRLGVLYRSYTMICLSVCGDTPRAISRIVNNHGITILYHLYKHVSVYNKFELVGWDSTSRSFSVCTTVRGAPYCAKVVIFRFFFL